MDRVFWDFFERFYGPSERLNPMDLPYDIQNGDSINDERKQPNEFNHDTFFNSPMNFMSEFEERFNSFFKGFPEMIIPHPNVGEIPSLQEHEGSSKNKKTTLQERMLNDKKGDPSPGLHAPPQPFLFPFRESRRPERSDNFVNTFEREDKDFDEDFRKGDRNLDDILPRGDSQPKVPPSSSFSFYSTTVKRDQNGVIETKKTVRDSRGNEEVTVTRKIDGKEYTMSHKKDEYGSTETRDVTNVGKDQSHHGMLMPEEPPVHNRQSSLYDRVRSWFGGEKE